MNMLKKILVLFLCFWMSCSSAFAMNRLRRGVNNIIAWGIGGISIGMGVDLYEEIKCIYKYTVMSDKTNTCSVFILIDDLRNDLGEYFGINNNNNNNFGLLNK